METGGATPGSGRALRLDPFSLPIRFGARDQAADGQVRQVELHRERVILRREVRGMLMAVGVPVSTFRGVTLRVQQDDDELAASACVTLDHSDDALTVPLFEAEDTDDVLAVWRAWGRVLGLPLLVAELSGTVHEPFPRLGALDIDDPSPRRRRRSALRNRRPRFLTRRKAGRDIADASVHRDEREIIARN
jgi:hypothetical protein